MTDTRPYPASTAALVLPHFPNATAAVAALTRRRPEPPLWQMIVDLLPDRDPEVEYYILSDIAPLVNITPHALAKHCRDLWPNWEGHYRLNYSQAVALIRRVCLAGKKLPTRDEIRRRKRGAL